MNDKRIIKTMFLSFATSCDRMLELHLNVHNNNLKTTSFVLLVCIQNVLVFYSEIKNRTFILPPSK